MPENTPDNGVLAQHSERMANDPAYREAALSINPDAPGGAALGKYNETDAPTSLSVHQAAKAGATATDVDYDALAGDDLDAAVRDANIEGRSSMTADEKRDALRAAAYRP